MNNPFFSIVTICFNNKVGLEMSIESVINQTFNNYEFIIIDGGSTDGTIDILNKYSSKFAYCVSEKDNGISDAFNKGVKNSKGDWILFLNSGDILFNPSVLELFAQNILTDNVLQQIYYGKILIENHNKKFEFGGDFNINTFTKRMNLPHQAIFFNKDFFNFYGYFDEKFKLAMDYELLLRPTTYNYKFINVVVSKMAQGGVSQNNIHRIYREYLIAKLLNTKKNVFILVFEYCYYYIIYLFLKILGLWKI